MTGFDPYKYARYECERRWLLAGIPEGAEDPRLIRDLYVTGTRLRLRHVGGQGYKLGHKVRPDPADPAVVAHTSMYLDASEFGLLSSLPGRSLAKVRRRLVMVGRVWAIDAFEGPLAGLVLAETEARVGDEVSPPPLAVREVTGDERFTGGRLAGARLTDLGLEAR